MHTGSRSKPWIFCLLFGLTACCSVSDLIAAESAPVEIVLKGLKRPSGVAIRPGGSAARYEVFVAESGAGAIVKWSNIEPDKQVPVVNGFELATASDPEKVTGVVALGFLDPGLLVVGITSDAKGELIRTFELTDSAEPIDASLAAGEESNTNKFPGATCTSLTRSRANGFVPDMLVLTVRDADGRGRLLKARVQAGILGSPRAFGKGEVKSAPRAVVTSAAGRIVVGDAGGWLTFYNPIDGAVELAMDTELKNLAALAVSPTTGSLYAANFDGGIHRIDDASKPGQPACRTVEVADAARPTSIAFAPDGLLYLTTFGSGEADGTLSVLSGDF
jgi:hypothetical protein